MPLQALQAISRSRSARRDTHAELAVQEHAGSPRVSSTNFLVEATTGMGDQGFGDSHDSCARCAVSYTRTADAFARPDSVLTWRGIRRRVYEKEEPIARSLQDVDPASRSSLLDELDQGAEGLLGVHEGHRGAATPRPRGLVDDTVAGRLHAGRAPRRSRRPGSRRGGVLRRASPGTWRPASRRGRA